MVLHKTIVCFLFLETSIFDGSIFGTESEFGLPPYPFAAIALLMIPILMMTLMSTSVAPRPIVTAAVSVTVPTNVLGTISTTQAVVQSSRYFFFKVH